MTDGFNDYYWVHSLAALNQLLGMWCDNVSEQQDLSDALKLRWLNDHPVLS